MQKIFLFLFVGAWGICVYQQTQNTIVNDVLLENVEALADMESNVPINCRGDGEFTCPGDDRKFAYVYIGYSLR